MIRLLIAGLVIGGLLHSPAFSQTSSVTLSPDGQFALVQKNVGDERWAIVQDRNNRKITGNVFSSSGGPAQFVWCDWIGGTNYRCSGSSGCYQQPCSWSTIGTVSLSDSFLSVPGGQPTPQPTSQPTPRPTPPATGLQGLIGTWDATFRIVSSYTYRYRFQEVRQSTVGNYQILVGRDEQNDVVLLARTHDLSPGTPTDYTYFVLEDDAIVCEAYLFNQTGPDRLSGVHSSALVVGGECGNAIGQNDANAIRVSRSASETASPQALRRAVKQQKRSVRGQARGQSAPPGIDITTLRALMNELRSQATSR